MGSFAVDLVGFIVALPILLVIAIAYLFIAALIGGAFLFGIMVVIKVLMFMWGAA